MRVFTKVIPAMWTNALFKALTDEERLLLFYYLSGPHQTITGVSRVPDGYAAQDLGWPLAKCEAVRSRLVEVGAIRFDHATCEVLVTDWWRDNGPDNDSHLIGARKALGAIASVELRLEAEEALDQEWQRRQAAKAATAAPRVSQALLEKLRRG